MKPLNTMKYITNATKDMVGYTTRIKEAATFEAAKEIASQMYGYINCMNTFFNTMICAENNGFTADSDEVIESWLYDMYQVLADKAAETEQDETVVMRCLRKRNEHHA